jgi:flavin-dependent dehydrogenase
MAQTVDVAIIGGGPAGSTVGTLLRKYNPRLKVLILEREQFPRDHVGESQLPAIGAILDEMGVWEKVERCNFPIKIGATYRWGRTDQLWDFEFLTSGPLIDAPRPGNYAGQRKETAFQVDRAIYDDVLLRHAQFVGCQVRQQTAVRRIETDGDRVSTLVLESGETVEARHYVDASGHAGLIRRAMGVEARCPTSLQNIAIWDYWQNAEWAVRVGVGGTRVQVMSVGYGWIWFIPLGPTRTSIGLIVPAQYYKSCGKKPAELYRDALANDPVIAPLLEKATSENKLATTKDWSFVAERLTGENWFLAGESAGFADPILAAGMTLAHSGAREVAYTILALERNDYEPEWLKSRYCQAHRRQIEQHIQFADYWYSRNGVFTDLLEYTAVLAKDRGLELDAKSAWRWFGTGGFVNSDSLGTGFGGYSLSSAKQIAANFSGDRLFYEVVGKSHFRTNLDGSTKDWGAFLSNGRIERHRCFARNERMVPNSGLSGWILNTLKPGLSVPDWQAACEAYWQQLRLPGSVRAQFDRDVIEMLEALVSDGWVIAETQPNAPSLPEPQIDLSEVIRGHGNIAAMAK